MPDATPGPSAGQMELTKAERGAVLSAAGPQTPATAVHLAVTVEAIIAARVERLTTALAEAEAERDTARAEYQRYALRGDEFMRRERRLRERIEALADECADSACIHMNTLYGRLRALLAEDGA